MVVEKEGFGAVKTYNIICYCLVIIVKKHRLYNSLQYTRDVYRNILKINSVTSSNNTSFPYLFYNYPWVPG